MTRWSFIVFFIFALVACGTAFIGFALSVAFHEPEEPDELEADHSYDREHEHRTIEFGTSLKLELKSKKTKPNCALCREGVGKKGWRCKRCGAALHRRCRKEMGKKRCPSVGCK